MWQVILFLAVSTVAYLVLRRMVSRPAETDQFDTPPQPETAKEWAARVHGLTFDDERRRRSGLPTLAEKQALDDASEDDDEAGFAEWRSTLTKMSVPGVVGAQLVIKYRDDPTPRPIRVIELMQGDHAHYLQSFCGLRDDYRMFRIAAITEVVTADGEIFDGGYDWLESLTGPF